MTGLEVILHYELDEFIKQIKPSEGTLRSAAAYVLTLSESWKPHSFTKDIVTMIQGLPDTERLALAGALCAEAINYENNKKNVKTSKTAR